MTLHKTILLPCDLLCNILVEVTFLLWIDFDLVLIAERRCHCILLNVNVQMYILNQFQDGRILRCVHVFTYLLALFMLLILVWIISWWIGQAIHFPWRLPAEEIPIIKEKIMENLKHRETNIRSMYVLFPTMIGCTVHPHLKYYKSTQWLWEFEASRLEMGQHRLQEYQCIISKVSQYSDASLLKSIRSMNILYDR